MTAAPSNLIITKGSAQLTIGLSRTEEDYSKTLTTFNTPRGTNNQDAATGPTETKILDLMLKTEVRHTFTNAVIETDLGTGDKNLAGATITDVTDKKSLLRQLFFSGMADRTLLTFTYDDEYFEGTIEKCKILKDSDDESPIRQYSVTITVLEGGAL